MGHAQLCFSLASLYADSPLGPGPLALGASAFSLTPDLAHMAHATVLEGCVNETSAALEAEAAHARAEPEAVRVVLETIISQESEHASLAFAFVSWALDVGGDPVGDAVRAAFARAATQLQSDSTLVEWDDDLCLAQHGRLSPAERQAVRKRGHAEVIAPAAAELMRKCTRHG